MRQQAITMVCVSYTTFGGIPGDACGFLTDLDDYPLLTAFPGSLGADECGRWDVIIMHP